MILSNRTILQSLVWVFVIATVAGIAEPIFLGSSYLSTAATLVFGAVCLILVLRYARARRLPAPECGADRYLPAESLVANSSYQLRICRTEAAQLAVLIEARFGLRAGLMALCPAGFLLVMPVAIIWATVSEPPTYWAWYPLILALFVFVVWLGSAIVAVNLRQGVWGGTRLTFAGDRLSHQVTWHGRVWIERIYRIGPAANVRCDLSNWFGVVIRGLMPEQPRPWWQWLLEMGPAGAVSFGAALAPADAQLAAAYIQQHLQTVQEHLRPEEMLVGAGI